MALGHSGHTLLGLLLDANPELAHLGDTILNRDRLGIVNCSCGVKTADCEFWRRVYSWENYAYLRDGFPGGLLGTGLFGRPALFPLLIKLRKLPAFTRYADTLGSFGSFIKTMTGRREFVFGRKRVCDVLVTLAGPRVRVKILHLTRHPFGHALSCRKRASKTGQSVERWAEEWTRYNGRVRACRMLGEDHRVHYVHVAYEDLCREPQRTLESLCANLGIGFEAKIANVDKKTQHLIGSKSVVRRTFSSVRAPVAGEDLELLSDRERESVWRICGALAHDLGYEKDSL